MSDQSPPPPQTSRSARAPAPPASVRGQPALIAPASADSSEANTIVLFSVPLEFLSVRVSFHGAPIPGLKLRLSTLDGIEVEAELETDEHGLARAARRVPAGIYLCELERQPPAQVSTVPAGHQSFPLVLPVGRPYLDVRTRGSSR